MKPYPPVLHPQAQVIITGKRVPLNVAPRLAMYTETMPVRGWCNPIGDIGFIDSVEPGTTYQSLCDSFHALCTEFMDLDLGITVMNGPPGHYNQPVASFSLKGTKFQVNKFPHIDHPPPRRLTRKR